MRTGFYKDLPSQGLFFGDLPQANAFMCKIHGPIYSSNAKRVWSFDIIAGATQEEIVHTYKHTHTHIYIYIYCNIHGIGMCIPYICWHWLQRRVFKITSEMARYTIAVLTIKRFISEQRYCMCEFNVLYGFSNWYIRTWTKLMIILCVLLFTS